MALCEGAIPKESALEMICKRLEMILDKSCVILQDIQVRVDHAYGSKPQTAESVKNTTSEGLIPKAIYLLDRIDATQSQTLMEITELAKAI